MEVRTAAVPDHQVIVHSGSLLQRTRAALIYWEVWVTEGLIEVAEIDVAEMRAVLRAAGLTDTDYEIRALT